MRPLTDCCDLLLSSFLPLISLLICLAVAINVSIARFIWNGALHSGSELKGGRLPKSSILLLHSPLIASLYWIQPSYLFLVAIESSYFFPEWNCWIGNRCNSFEMSWGEGLNFVEAFMFIFEYSKSNVDMQMNRNVICKKFYMFHKLNCSIFTNN